LFHFFEDRPQTKIIPAETLKKAISVCGWYLQQFAAVFNPDISIRRDADALLKSLVAWMTRKSGGSLPDAQTLSSLTMPVRHLRDYGPKRLRIDKSRFELALAQLASANRVRLGRAHVQGSTKPTQVVELLVEKVKPYHQIRKEEEQARWLKEDLARQQHDSDTPPHLRTSGEDDWP